MMAYTGRFIRVGLIVALAASGASHLADRASAAFIPVETFENRSLGNIGGQGDWLSQVNAGTPAGFANVAVDPANPTNQVLHRSGNAGASNSGAALAIPDGTTATFFLRVRRASATNDDVFGLSDVVNPNMGGDFSPFEAQSGVNNLALRLRDGGSTQSPATLVQDVWYNVWMVVDNAADNWRLLLQSDDDPAFVTQTELFSTTAGNTDIDFRNGVASNPLVSFLVKATNGATTSVYYDDLYIDKDGTNLANPVPEPTALGLALVALLAMRLRRS